LDLLSAMKERKSCRAFLDKPVSRGCLEDIIQTAGYAPSAINVQPWEFVVSYGEEKDRLIRRIKKTHKERHVTCGPGTVKPLPDQFVNRSRMASKVMEACLTQMDTSMNTFVEDGSCSFYGAPIVLIVVIDTIFPKIRYIDIGLSISYLLLAAHASGLATCPIGLITAYGDDIADVLDISTEKEVLLGIALGYEDETSPINQFKTDRAPLDQILRWYE
jgi:nitroreductase